MAAFGRNELWGRNYARYCSRHHTDPLLIGAIPTWGHSSGWGYGPSGILGVILVVVLILALTGRL